MDPGEKGMRSKLPRSWLQRYSNILSGARASRNKRKRLPQLVPVILALLSLNGYSQRIRGELRVEVRDPQGAAVGPSGELVSQGNQLKRTFQVGSDGRYVAQDLPFGVYRLSLSAQGFAQWVG